VFTVTTEIDRSAVICRVAEERTADDELGDGSACRVFTTGVGVGEGDGPALPGDGAADGDGLGLPAGDGDAPGAAEAVALGLGSGDAEGSAGAPGDERAREWGEGDGEGVGEGEGEGQGRGHGQGQTQTQQLDAAAPTDGIAPTDEEPMAVMPTASTAARISLPRRPWAPPGPEALPVTSLLPRRSRRPHLRYWDVPQGES